eukprot:1801354-Lingulodinium_polyedra.AAC.1
MALAARTPNAGVHLAHALTCNTKHPKRRNDKTANTASKIAPTRAAPLCRFATHGARVCVAR